MPVLIENVTLRDPETHNICVLRAGDEPPDWADGIISAKLLADQVATEPDSIADDATDEPEDVEVADEPDEPVDTGDLDFTKPAPKRRGRPRKSA